jgi:hypothetical protein
MVSADAFLQDSVPVNLTETKANFPGTPRRIYKSSTIYDNLLFDLDQNPNQVKTVNIINIHT